MKNSLDSVVRVIFLMWATAFTEGVKHLHVILRGGEGGRFGTKSILLGEPFDFLSNVPSLGWMMRIPRLSCCRQIYRNKVARRIIQCSGKDNIDLLVW